jgi:putative ABC transport system substrate-binding protein
MRRREFIVAFAGATFVWPRVARGEKAIPVIAILGSGAADAASSKMQMSHLNAGMREVGLVEGRDFVFEIRWAGSDASRFDALATELLAKNPRAVVVSTVLAAFALQKLSRTVPIVGTGLNDPVGTGLVASLAHPGGNITGVATMAEDLQLKLLQMLCVTLPDIRKVLAVVNPTNPSTGPMLEALKRYAASKGLTIDVVEVGAPADLDAAFAQVSRRRVGAVLVLTDNSLLGLASPIITRALEANLPTVGSFGDVFAQAGGLYSYGRDPREAFYGVARLLKKILDGAAPGDIPIEQPTKFNLFINLKTAKSLGIEIPPSLHATADEVVE